MPRRQHRAQRKFDTRLTFKQLCNKLGITPQQRVVMLRYMREKVRIIDNENT